MGQEIERKYLVNKEKWNLIEKPQKHFYRQAYLLNELGKTIRVRITESDAYLTIKGDSVGAIRPEFEYKIPKSEAEEMIEKFSVSEISKIRYKITYKGKVWEIDEFLGNNSGLILAEIELNSETENFELPDCIEKEVTDDRMYYNSNLSIHPFSKW